MIRIKLLIGALVLAAAFMAGWTINGWRYSNRLAQMKTQAAQQQNQLVQQNRHIEQKAQRLTNQIARAQAAAAQQQATTQATIQREVNHYAKSHHSPDTATTHCRLDADWVRLHNASATGHLPRDSPAATKPSAATATTTDALRTVTHNYAIAHQCQRKLTGWQAWYQQVKEVLHDKDSTTHP